MKNRKDNIPSNAELRNYFKGFCSEDEMEKTISDARKAFTMLNKNKEFRK